MTAIVIYEKGLHTRCNHLQSGNTIETDAPTDNHGRGAAFSPTDLTATSLAACMLTTMGIYAEKNGISLDGMKAEVTKIMAPAPRRIARVKVTLFLPHVLTPAERSALEDIAFHCPVALSLHPELKQEVSFVY